MTQNFFFKDIGGNAKELSANGQLTQKRKK